MKPMVVWSVWYNRRKLERATRPLGRTAESCYWQLLLPLAMLFDATHPLFFSHSFSSYLYLFLPLFPPLSLSLSWHCCIYTVADVRASQKWLTAVVYRRELSPGAKCIVQHIAQARHLRSRKLKGERSRPAILTHAFLLGNARFADFINPSQLSSFCFLFNLSEQKYESFMNRSSN